MYINSVCKYEWYIANSYVLMFQFFFNDPHIHIYYIINHLMCFCKITRNEWPCLGLCLWHTCQYPLREFSRNRVDRGLIFTLANRWLCPIVLQNVALIYTNALSKWGFLTPFLILSPACIGNIVSLNIHIGHENKISIKILRFFFMRELIF